MRYGHSAVVLGDQGTQRELPAKYMLGSCLMLEQALERSLLFVGKIDCNVGPLKEISAQQLLYAGSMAVV